MDWDKLEQDAYRYLNLTPHELYEYTHREFTNMMEGYKQHHQDNFEQQLKYGQWTAWHVASYVGMSFNGDKLPDLGDILTKPLFQDRDEIPKEIPEEELTEEQKYIRYRNRWIQIKKMGLVVPQDILDQYNIH